jgi:predicted Zn-dependent protease
MGENSAAFVPVFGKSFCKQRCSVGTSAYVEDTDRKDSISASVCLL